jgi:hypothetical protein
MVSKNLTYRQKDCVDLIYQRQVNKDCNCTNVSLIPIDDELKLCFESGELECIGVTNTKVKGLLDDFSSICPLECETTKYTVSSSMSSPISPNFIHFLKNSSKVRNYYGLNITDQQFGSSIVSFYINYDELEYTEIVEMPSYTLTILISNIGGTFGLFLGVSVLSFVEIIEIVIEIIINKSNGAVHSDNQL